MHRFVRSIAVLALAIAASACSHGAQTDPQTMADATTRGAYDADLDRTTQYFDSALKLQVTRTSLGQLSDCMHGYGALQNFTPASSDPDKGRYTTRRRSPKARCSSRCGSIPSGRIGAYRAAPIVSGPGAGPIAQLPFSAPK